MAQSLRLIAFFVFTLCVMQGAEAQDSSLSADDTATYINTTLHKYPTLEFVDTGCPGYEQVVSISKDRRSIIITQTFGRAAEGKCSDVKVLTVPIFSIARDGLGGWSKQGQHSSFFIDCINRVDCFSIRSGGQEVTAVENNWHLHLTAPDLVSIRLKKAVQHLVDSLLAEATSRIDPNDAFAKHVR